MFDSKLIHEYSTTDLNTIVRNSPYYRERRLAALNELHGRALVEHDERGHTRPLATDAQVVAETKRTTRW